MWREGDQVCAAMERAITQQPPDRGGINVVGASDISLRLGPAAAMTEPLRGLRRATYANAATTRVHGTARRHVGVAAVGARSNGGM
jgi:hypothetical protein